MKVLAVLLLCACVAVQGRSAVGKSGRTEAALGENPWLVHLRYAIATSGLLESGVGSLISNNWVLTSGEALSGVRFVWVRYGVVSVVNPSLVTETNTLRYASSKNVALINVNRYIEPTANIAPIALGSSLPDSASFCGFGASSEDGPGETLACFPVDLVEATDSITASSDDGAATKYDLGAPLVSEGVQIAILVQEGDDEKAGVFAPVADYLEWIQEETGIEVTFA